MSILLSYYSGVLTEALTIGAIIGAIVGVIVFTASSASEGLQRVVFGFVLGGVLMGVFQAIIIGTTAGVGVGNTLNPLLQAEVGPFGSLVFNAILLSFGAALAGGLFMVVSLAPLRALLGAVAGAILGMVSGLAAWGVLRYVDARVPLVIFYILIFGIVLFILDNLPVRGR